MINPTETEVTVNLDLSGFALNGDGTRWHFSGPDEFAHNVPGKERVIEIAETALNRPTNDLSSPALSASIFVLPLE